MGTRYAPLLKAKDAEIQVLSDTQYKDDITPIFELQLAPKLYVDKVSQTEKNKNSTATHASFFVDYIARRWNRPMFVDVHRVVGADSAGPWWRLLSVLADVGSVTAPMAPVIHLNDDPGVAAQARPLAKNAGSAALRVALPHPNINVISDEIHSIADSLEIDVENISVIFDWGERLEDHRLDDIDEGTRIAIDLLKGKHADIITLGTPDCSGCEQAGDWQLTRREWWLWLRLRSHLDSVVYGDYALYPPADPGYGRRSYGHLRYSYEDKLWVHRRGIPKTRDAGIPASLGGAFRLCCQAVVGSDHFYGPEFSDADEQIHKIATVLGDKPTGSATDWRELSFKHHLEVVTRQLAAPPEAPPAGTE